MIFCVFRAFRGLTAIFRVNGWNIASTTYQRKAASRLAISDHIINLCLSYAVWPSCRYKHQKN